MKARKSANTELEEAKSRLLGEGAKLYLAGRNALKKFQWEVQARCESVVKVLLPNHAIALNVKPESLRMDGFAFAVPSGRLASVGVKLKSAENPPMYFGLWWQDDNTAEHSISVGAKIPLETQKRAAALVKAFNEIDSTSVVRKGRWVSLSEKLAVETIPAFEEKLEEVVCRWIRLWEGVGGFKGLSKIASLGSE